MSKAPGSFQLPQSCLFSAPGSATLSSSQPKIPLQVATLVPSSSLALSPQSNWEMLDAAAPNPNPEAPALQKPSANSGATMKTGGSSQNPSTTRSLVALERHINAMAEQLEEYMSSNSSQHQETHEQLTCLTAIVDSLVSAHGLTLALGSDQLMSRASGTPDPQPNLSNPAPTRELTLIIAKVVSEA
ncbi:hypothetical protein FRC12_012685 [Ceratobasidium sp. 428]|nr:hypothetical protein FRC12_012685 [Ceratobasidium sp. 428]